jgi:hypothetical protein
MDDEMQRGSRGRCSRRNFLRYSKLRGSHPLHEEKAEKQVPSYFELKKRHFERKLRERAGEEGREQGDASF